ncbi:MAG: asparagine synthetase [Candidatus Aminicenantes bacterium]|jgi:asparaginyl-tRNA synthetase|nr:asparagine synthetase [Candidatus Aminicenantes bacterium]
MLEIDQYIKELKSEKIKQAISVQSKLIQAARDFLIAEGFIEILPVIISPITDPLTDYRVRGEIECYGFKYQITKSMIFHKQIALMAFPKIFCLSPNVRIEPAERMNSGRHLIEFVQLDLEVRGASRDEIIELGERLFSYLIFRIKESCQEELKFFGRELPDFVPPFGRITYEEALNLYGQDLELLLSRDNSQPVWLIDFPLESREFYDREDENRPGVLVDMDLIYPEGYGEALSGGEREYQYEKIINRISQKGISLEAYDLYLKFARNGLYPSAGFGFGVERLTRFICGLSDIKETRLFAKKPGVYGL